MRWIERVIVRQARRTRATGFRVAVVTDSAAAFPGDWLTISGPVAGVTVVSMPVMISGRIFGEGSDDLTEPLTIALAEGAEVRTSRPSPGQFESVYRRLQNDGFDEILSIHLSGKLSGTVDAARWAAGAVSIPVQVIDSGTVGMALGFGVAAAAHALDSGRTTGEAAAEALETCNASSLYFYVPSLDQLRRGGRIGAAASVLGTLLAVKPILTVKDGLIVPLERVRTAPKAL
ncbi:DegV family protein, partial [Arthrobacter sp. H5]|uniref:DegV family protein n=1 Tax=Arthrobacter sp. H5 TaxID=1267973 RepID=UPI0012DC8EC0